MSLGKTRPPNARMMFATCSARDFGLSLGARQTAFYLLGKRREGRNGQRILGRHAGIGRLVRQNKRPVVEEIGHHGCRQRQRSPCMRSFARRSKKKNKKKQQL